VRHIIWCLAAVLSAATVASAAPITIDDYSHTGGLNGSGIQVNSSTTTAGVTDTNLTNLFLGGSRAASLTAQGFVGNNGKATLSINGGQLRYDSGNATNGVNGLFSMTYSGSPGFPANFTGELGISVDVVAHNNPGAAGPTTITLQLTDSTGNVYSATQVIAGNINPTDPTLDFPFTSFTGGPNPLVLSSITQVKLTVDPGLGTNMDISSLRSFSSSGGGGTGDPDPNVVPEPASLVAFGVLAVCGLLVARRRKAKAAE
jgi:hypothetical protein